MIINEIAPVLSHIFNRSSLTSIVPSQLKIAKVNPVFKSGDNQVFSNYRPIFILPSISKILEKIMHNYLFDFVTKSEIFSPHQYDFRPNRSTYMAINDLHCKITDDLDNKHHSLGIFLDLSKAFDTLNHDILLHKLNIYGIRGLANSWIKNYLSNRKQFMLSIITPIPPTVILFAVYHKDQSLVHFYFFSSLFPHPPPTS